MPEVRPSKIAFFDEKSNFWVKIWTKIDVLVKESIFDF